MRDLRGQHRAALRLASDRVEMIDAVSWSNPSPCDGWDLAQLLAHMMGQNNGFASAIRDGDADKPAYLPDAARPEELPAVWAASVESLCTAAAQAGLDQPVRLVEVRPDTTLPVGAVIAIHLLDTVVHTWDLARSIHVDFRPPDEMLEIVEASARQVPTGPSRKGPAAAFAPPAASTGHDRWESVLALLGRHPSDEQGSR